MSELVKPTYVKRWPFLVAFVMWLAPGVLVAAGRRDWIVAIVAQAGIVIVSFVAGFCYRESLRLLGRPPRWRGFRRMLG